MMPNVCASIWAFGAKHASHVLSGLFGERMGKERAGGFQRSSVALFGLS